MYAIFCFSIKKNATNEEPTANKSVVTIGTTEPNCVLKI